MAEESAAVTVSAAGHDVKVVRVKGDVDYENAPLLAEALRRVGDPGARLLVADLSELAFADSTVLHVLLEVQRRRRLTGGRMIIAGPLQETVGRLFEVTGTTTFFEFAPTVEAATRAR
ncbi:STAS domain-containing protein [Streptomyces fuscigenes]|uniref:STAS domain-containing protein n=1 Tax=Streptomyces fuscigenes TaxID=1528880 RepID=UPI001F47FE90|nr:STAS domain-containing protein [Streptomyces fuscigenes]MCF3964186.1 STAS domain-containing protein [Streptomyces fuscigenes]